MATTTIEQILDATDLVALIGERVALKRVGKEFVGLCPFHNDHRASLTVSPSKRIFKCFSCGAGGDALRFVQMFERVGFRQALELLANRAGIDLAQGSGPHRDDAQREELRRVMKWARSHFMRNLAQTPAGQAARQYALRRGMTDATLERFGIGFAADAWDDLILAARRAGVPQQALQKAGLITTGESQKIYDRFRNRLMFPIADTMGRVLAFGGRTLGDDPAKYLNSPETELFSKSRVLFAMDQTRLAIAAKKSAIVVEGYLDAVLLVQAGVEYVVATLGTAFADAQIKIIKPYCERLYLCFDGDAAGLRAADRACEIAVRSGLDIRVVILPEGEDPADCIQRHGPDVFNNYLQTARSALHFKWEQTQTAFESGGGSRRTAIEAYLAFVVGVCDSGAVDPVEQGLLLGRLSELLGLPAEQVYSYVGALRRQRRSQKSKTDGAAPADSRSTGPKIPAGLESAVEELLGLLVRSSECMQLVNDDFLRGVRQNPAWERLYQLMQNCFEEHSRFSQADLVGACDDAETLAILSKVTQRVPAEVLDSPAIREMFHSTCSRLAEELSLMAARDAVRDVDLSAEQGSEWLRRLTRAARHGSALPTQYRLHGPEV